jgi:hypothetical protein
VRDVIVRGVDGRTNSGMLNFQRNIAFVELSDCRTIGLSHCRTIGLSDYRIIGRTPTKFASKDALYFETGWDTFVIYLISGAFIIILWGFIDINFHSIFKRR